MVIVLRNHQGLHREDATDQGLAHGHISAVLAGANYRVGAAAFAELGAGAEGGRIGISLGGLVESFVGGGGGEVGGDGGFVFEPGCV